MTETFLDIGVDWQGPGYRAKEFVTDDLATRP